MVSSSEYTASAVPPRATRVEGDGPGSRPQSPVTFASESTARLVWPAERMLAAGSTRTEAVRLRSDELTVAPQPATCGVHAGRVRVSTGRFVGGRTA